MTIIQRLPRRSCSLVVPSSIISRISSSSSPSVPCHTPLSRTPCRHATMIRRPRRPYTFTQMVQLSDGSTYTMRTTSPLALYRSTKDTRNTVLWQPNDRTLRNVEVDEAGRLAAFRERFGRGWDAEKPVSPGSGVGEEEGNENGESGRKGGMERTATGGGGGDALGDLISGYASPQQQQEQRDFDQDVVKKEPEKKQKK